MKKFGLIHSKTQIHTLTLYKSVVHGENRAMFIQSVAGHSIVFMDVPVPSHTRNERQKLNQVFQRGQRYSTSQIIYRLDTYPVFLPFIQLYNISRSTKITPCLVRSNATACTVNQTKTRVFPVTTKKWFDCRKCLLDWVEVRRVRRQENKLAFFTEVRVYQLDWNANTYELDLPKEHGSLLRDECYSCQAQEHYAAWGMGWWAESMS
jgi:hypothetical protein